MRRIVRWGLVALVGPLSAAFSTGRSVDLGPDSPADVIVCLDPSLTRDEFRDFAQNRFLAGHFGSPEIDDYTAQGKDALTFNWRSEATEGDRNGLLSELRGQPEVTVVAEDSTVVDACRS